VVPVLTSLRLIKHNDTFRIHFAILFSHHHLNILSGISPSGFPKKFVYAFVVSPTRSTGPVFSSFFLFYRAK
jgi:hypothetical protein